MTHELSLVADLLRKVNSLAAEMGAGRVSSVQLRLGAWAPLSPEVMQEQFSLAAQGTAAEGAMLHIARTDTLSQDILLESIEVEEQEP